MVLLQEFVEKSLGKNKKLFWRGFCEVLICFYEGKSFGKVVGVGDKLFARNDFANYWGAGNFGNLDFKFPAFINKIRVHISIPGSRINRTKGIGIEDFLNGFY